ncbi:MAG: CAP domain-containing protein [Trueperaceae bacterium]|nr:CAP domain-containing protein [Trueperaceae bacterium]
MICLNSLLRVFFSSIIFLALAACELPESPDQPTDRVTAVEIESLDNPTEASCDFGALACELTSDSGYFGVQPRVVGEGNFSSDVTFSFSNPIAECSDEDNANPDSNYCTVSTINPAVSGETVLTVASVQDPSKTAQVSITVNLPDQPTDRVTAVEIESLDNPTEASCDFGALACELTSDSGYFGVQPRVVGEGSFNPDVTFSFSNPIAECSAEDNANPDSNYCTVSTINPAVSGETVLTVASVQDPSKTAQVSITVNLPDQPTDRVTAVEIESLDNPTEASCDFGALACELTSDSGYFGVQPRVVGEGNFSSDVTFSFSNPIAECSDEDNANPDSNYCTASTINPAVSGETVLTVASVQDPSKTAQVSITIALPSSGVTTVSGLQAAPQTEVVEGSSLTVRYTWSVTGAEGADVACTFRIAFGDVDSGDFSDYVQEIPACGGEQTVEHRFTSYQNFHYATLEVRDSRGETLRREHTFLAEPAFGILRAINTARSQARDCGSTRYPATHPLRWDEQLATAAEQHSQDMAQRDYFSHRSPEGEGPGERIRAAGYDLVAYSENISAGHDNHDDALASWLTSAGHCRNIMSATMRDVGVGYGNSASSTYRHYWTQKFAVRR